MPWGEGAGASGSRGGGQCGLAALLVLDRCLDEGVEERMAVPRGGLELGVELHADEPRMHLARQLDDLGELFALRERGDDEARAAELVEVVHVRLVAVAVALGDNVAVDLVRQRARGDVGALRAQAHGAAQVGGLAARLDGAVGILPLGDQRDHGVRRGGVELSAVGVLEARHMACVLDGGHLHAQADAQVGYLLLAGVARRADLAFHAARAEAAGHEDGVVPGQLLGRVGRADGLGIDVLDLHAHVVLHPRVAQRLVHRLVAVGQVDVLAHHGDGDLALRMFGFVHELVPALEAGGRRVQAQLVADQAVQALLVQHAGHLVDGVHVPHADHAPFGHVGEQGDLAALLVGDAAVGPAEQGVGLDADLAQLLHRVLGGLGLEFARRRDVGQVGEVDEGGIVRPHAQAHLAHGFEEGQGFDVAHRAADLDDGHVHRVLGADARAALDVFLDLVGDVRDHLHRLAQVVAAALLLQHGLVDAARGEVVGLLHARFDETLIVAEVEVGFGAVVGDEHFAVLERGHGARIHVDVRVELDEGDFEAARFEDRSKGG